MIPDAQANQKDFRVALLSDFADLVETKENLQNKRCQYKQLQEEFRPNRG